MNCRAQQYYKINVGLKKAYHQRVREDQDSQEEITPIREINEHIIARFEQLSLISQEWAEALAQPCACGHTHTESSC